MTRLVSMGDVYFMRQTLVVILVIILQIKKKRAPKRKILLVHAQRYVNASREIQSMFVLVQIKGKICNDFGEQKIQLVIFFNNLKQGYKGRKRGEGFRRNFHLNADHSKGCLVSQEQINAWLHINGQKCIRGHVQPQASEIEHDCRVQFEQQ